MDGNPFVSLKGVGNCYGDENVCKTSRLGYHAQCFHKVHPNENKVECVDDKCYIRGEYNITSKNNNSKYYDLGTWQ